MTMRCQDPGCALFGWLFGQVAVEGKPLRGDLPESAGTGPHSKGEEVKRPRREGHERELMGLGDVIQQQDGAFLGQRVPKGSRHLGSFRASGFVLT